MRFLCFEGGYFYLILEVLIPEIEPRSPELQADSLPAEPQGKPSNTRVGSLSRPQGIFLTQESNWGLVHGRQILYQLRYEGSPLGFDSWVRKICWRREGLPTPVFWSGEFHGLQSMRSQRVGHN